MTFKTEKTRTLYGRHAGYRATCGNLSTDGKTVTEARDKLAPMVEWACSVDSSWIESRFNLIGIVAASANGFEWRVLDPRELTHGQNLHCTTFVGQKNKTDVVMEMRLAMAQRAWPGAQSLPESDETFMDMAGLAHKERDQLRSWIKWQREQIATTQMAEAAE